MRILRVILVLIASAGLIWAVAKNAKNNHAQQDQQIPQQDPQLFRASPGERITLTSIAKKAKAKGITKVTLQLPEGRQAVVRDFNDAVSRHYVVVAQLTDKTSLVTDPLSLHIVTFYRLKILESLNDKSTPCCDSGASIPESLPRLGEGEVYLEGVGGTAVFDGVEFIQEEFIGQLVIGQRYLFFLSSKFPGRLASLHLGSNGVYRIAGVDNRIEAVSKKASPLTRIINQDFNSSLENLKEGVKRYQMRR